LLGDDVGRAPGVASRRLSGDATGDRASLFHDFVDPGGVIFLAILLAPWPQHGDWTTPVGHHVLLLSFGYVVDHSRGSVLEGSDADGRSLRHVAT
jgi:hypothetical protein